MECLNECRQSIIALFVALLPVFSIAAFGQGESDLPYIQNENFVANAFTFTANIKNFKKHYSSLFSISKKPITNTHNKAIIDTIYVFSAGKTRIEIYKAKERDFLQSAHVETNKIMFYKNIKIGDLKDSIAKRLNTRIKSNKIQIGNLEQTQVYTLTFFGGKLAAITYEGYLE